MQIIVPAELGRFSNDREQDDKSNKTDAQASHAALKTIRCVRRFRNWRSSEIIPTETAQNSLFLDEFSAFRTFLVFIVHILAPIIDAQRQSPGLLCAIHHRQFDAAVPGDYR